MSLNAALAVLIYRNFFHYFTLLKMSLKQLKLNCYVPLKGRLDKQHKKYAKTSYFHHDTPRGNNKLGRGGGG